MRLTLATNWDLKLLDEVADLPIHTMYGKLPFDLVGGGRPASILPHINREFVASYIARCHQQGIMFNYLMNAACLGNMELEQENEAKILAELGWADSIGVDYITVVTPYLLRLIKDNFPRIKVVISIFSHVSSIQRARFFEELGADEITIIQKFNRDFEFLRNMRKAIKIDMQLLANTGCLFGCPYRGYHQNVNAHASQSCSKGEGFYIDYPFISCSRAKMKDPVELIKSRWIRPEDLHHYEALGIDKFKLMERTKSTSWLARTAKAYANRRYDGNLVDIISLSDERESGLKRSAIKYFKRPDCVNLEKMRKITAALQSAEFLIDNNRLDGFLDFFYKKDCVNISCSECNYCARIAKKVCYMEGDQHDASIAKFDEVLKSLTSSDMFR